MYRYSTLIFLLFWLTAAVGQPKERIISFHSDILIEADGRIEVAEHIKVYAAGDEIRRGIVRELPLYRKNNVGKRVRIEPNIIAIKRDGVATKYDVEYEGGNMLVYIRDKEVLLRPGEYDFTVVYDCYGHIGFFDDFDELYWNVTGWWFFPIEKASASITLPDHAKAIRTNYYTGVQGAVGKDCRVEDHGNVQRFTTTRQFAPYEGLTVAVAFPRDIITRPPPPTKGEVYWNKNGATISGWGGVLICLFYFFTSLSKVGKRPVKPVAIPTFKPPRDLSPASIHYLSTRQHNKKAFTATLVEMAVKGAMSILCKKEGKYSLKKYSLVNKLNTERLRPEQIKVHTTIFGDSQTEVNVDQTNYLKFFNADTELKKSMEHQWNLKDFFRENRGHSAIGGLILHLIFTSYLFLTSDTQGPFYALAMASPFVISAFVYWLSSGLAVKPGCTSLVAALSLGLLGMMSVLVDDEMSAAIHWPSVLFFAGMSIFYIWYAKRIKMFTPDGARLAAEMEGFRIYMKTAEEHRLNLLTPPERTPELFEKLLPYAIALGVSNEWCKKFNDVLKQFNYNPQWYKGNEDFAAIGFASSFASLSSSFSSSVTSASSSSGSSDWSSGSGGGGYSGGGGGGGGGRGC